MRARRPVGVVLAGGAGERLGGAKAGADLAGRPLISYPLDALREALGEVVVVAKPGSDLPDLGDVPVWLEPPEPRHPLTGLVAALERAGGRAVLACAADLPLLTPAVVREVAEADSAGAPAVVARADGRLQPLLARYEPESLGGLAGAPAGVALRDAVMALAPRVLEIADVGALFNVNTQADLDEAARRLAAQDRSRLS